MIGRRLSDLVFHLFLVFLLGEADIKEAPMFPSHIQRICISTFLQKVQLFLQLAEFGELQDFNLKSFFVPQNPIYKDFFFFQEMKHMHLFCACAGKLVSFCTPTQIDSRTVCSALCETPSHGLISPSDLELSFENIFPDEAQFTQGVLYSYFGIISTVCL